MRVLVNSDSFVSSPYFTDANGEAADLTAPPTCAVTREDGTALTAAVVDDPAPADGRYRAKLLAGTHCTRVDWLTLTWTGTMTGLGTIVQTQRVDVVGGVYCTVPELRAVPYSIASTVASAEAINDKVEEFEQLAEEYCGEAFVPRYAVERLVGASAVSVQLRNGPLAADALIAAASVDTSGVSTTYVTTNWLLDPITRVLTTDGDVLIGSVYGEPNLTLRYRYGANRPPVELVKACKAWVRQQLLTEKTGYQRDVISQSDDQGFSIRYSTPDWDAGRPTGLFDVDRVLNSIGRAAPVVV